MTIEVVTATQGMDDPGSPGWEGAPRAAVALAPVGIDAQPTEYIRVAWSDRPYGTVAEVEVAAACDGDELLVRLEWADGDGASDEFPDAAAVVFPEGDDAPVATMGSAELPLCMWMWRAGREDGRRVRSCGPGVFRRDPEAAGLGATATLEAGRWSLVVRGPSEALTTTPKLGVVVWNGSNEERAGLGSVTTDWVPVRLES